MVITDFVGKVKRSAICNFDSVKSIDGTLLILFNNEQEPYNYSVSLGVGISFSQIPNQVF